jgi:hypothetical protein
MPRSPKKVRYLQNFLLNLSLQLLNPPYAAPISLLSISSSPNSLLKRPSPADVIINKINHVLKPHGQGNCLWISEFLGITQEVLYIKHSCWRLVCIPQVIQWYGRSLRQQTTAATLVPRQRLFPTWGHPTTEPMLYFGDLFWCYKIPYFPAHKTQGDFFFRNFRKK